MERAKSDLEYITAGPVYQRGPWAWQLDTENLPSELSEVLLADLKTTIQSPENEISRSPLDLADLKADIEKTLLLQHFLSPPNTPPNLCP